jgi:DNA-binding CsgD family transcriptional regulator
MAASRHCRSIVKSIIDLAGELHLNCTAGGVDSEELASELEGMGIGGLQGNLICSPRPVEAIPAWLAVWNSPVSAPPEVSAQPISAPQLSYIAKSTAVMTRDGEGPSIENARVAGPAAVHLPPRQLQVMRSLAEGQSVKEIANRLGLGVGTVKVHVSLAYLALGARNRVEAIRRAGPLLDIPGEQISGYRWRPGAMAAGYNAIS